MESQIARMGLGIIEMMGIFNTSLSLLFLTLAPVSFVPSWDQIGVKR